MPARLMHVDLDAFFVEVCRQRHPELRALEYLVVGGHRDGRGVVQSASYAARRRGVHSGMPVAEAARRCPEATFFQGSFTHYREASRAVAATLRRFAPSVLMASLDEAYLDLRDTRLLYPVSLLPFAEAVRDAVKAESGLDCSIGIGPNRMVAKLASDHAKPRGLMEVRPGWEAGFLAGLPLSALPGVGPRTAERWAALGLVDVAQVQQMAERDLERLIGRGARVLKRRAEGHGGTTLATDRLPRSVTRETTLPRDERDPARLEALLALFAARVAAQLRGEGLAARTVTIKLRDARFQTVTRQSTLPHPTALDREILAAALPLFRSAFDDCRRSGLAVRLVGLGATGLVTGPALDLFEAPDRARDRQLADAVDRLRARYGFDVVTSARLLALRARPAKGDG